LKANQTRVGAKCCFLLQQFNSEQSTATSNQSLAAPSDAQRHVHTVCRVESTLAELANANVGKFECANFNFGIALLLGGHLGCDVCR
jgi:hypothetical protein